MEPIILWLGYVRDLKFCTSWSLGCLHTVMSLKAFEALALNVNHRG